MPYSNKENKKLYDTKWKKENKERINKQLRERRALNREEFNAKARKYQQENKERIELNRIKKLYGLEAHEYLSMYEKQKGLCAICSTWKKRLNVDHCHSTLIIRGLLCHSCNLGLGHFKDSIERAKNVVKYLEDSKTLV
jgi:post-segregation antitoxin (ccd killing protein)